MYMEQENDGGVRSGGGKRYGNKGASTLHTRSAPADNGHHPKRAYHEEKDWLFQAMFEQANMGIACILPQGQFVLANQCCCDTLSYTREELLNRSYDDIVHPADRENSMASLLEDVSGPQSSSSREKRFMHKDGSLVWVNLSVSHITNAKGVPTYFLLFLEDITARKRQEEERAQALVREQIVHAEVDMASKRLQFLQPLLANAEMIVLPMVEVEEVKISSLLSSQGKPVTESILAKRLAELVRDVLNCQRVGITTIEAETGILRARAVVGLSPEQEEQWWIEQRQQESRLDDSPAPELIDRLRANEVLQFDLTQPPYNQQPNPYHVKTMLIAPMLIGDQLVGFLTLDHGVGDSKHVYTSEEMALAGTVANLVGLVIERERLLREREVSRANVIALREANKRMDEFLGIACHELKTPLAAIKGNIQLAERRLARLTRQQEKPLDTLLPGLLGNANRQTDRLDRLVSDLLDVSRIQASKLEMREAPCDLMDIVRDAVQEQRLIWPNRKLLLEMPSLETVPINADAVRIGQVVTNFLTNALKYSLEDCLVEVTFSVEDNTARVAVRDQGPGFPSEEKEHIWERFHRVKGVEVQSGSGVGLGLGLYISRTIIERHGGHVDVESVPGQGSTFWFTLPLTDENVVQ
jgi:PAS domain S-box-containing protein